MIWYYICVLNWVYINYILLIMFVLVVYGEIVFYIVKLVIVDWFYIYKDRRCYMYINICLIYCYIVDWVWGSVWILIFDCG